VLIAPTLLVLANISVNFILKNIRINSRSGLMDTFSIIFQTTSTSFLEPLTALMIFLGCFGCLSTWMLTLSVYLQKLSNMGYIPKLFSYENKNYVPSYALFFQGMLFSIICLMYNLSVYVQTIYWFLCDLTAQVALIAMVICLLSALRLRVRTTWGDAYTFTKYKYVSIVIYCIGILGCIGGFTMGFLTPPSDDISTLKFNLLLLLGIIVIFIVPFFIKRCIMLRNNGKSFE
jgi:amino acid transporter